MAQDEYDPENAEAAAKPDLPPARSRRWRLLLAIVGGVLLLALLYGWFTREQIADSVISGQLEELGLPAQYEIESIGPRAQVLRNVVIGDPERPDLTIERVEAGLVAGRIKLVRPRLYGTYRDGKLSFGSLDPLIFTDSEEPFRLPDFDLVIVDGRGLLESDYGPIGVKTQGQGPLRDGFSGILAIAAPRLEAGDCTADKASFFAKVSVRREKPHIAGPLRLGTLSCPQQDLTLANAAMEVDATIDQPLDGAEGRLAFEAAKSAFGPGRMRSAAGKARFTYRKDALTARYELTGKGIGSPQAIAETLQVEGVARTADGFGRVEIEGNVDGKAIRLGQGLASAMGEAARASEGTLVQPVLDQLRTALLREGRASTLKAGFLARQAGDGASLVVPQATLRGGSGQALLSFSRFQVSAGGQNPPRIAGNFATGGKGLPRIAGRMERRPSGGLAMRLHMPEYRAGTSRIALPELLIVQSDGGELGFAGQAQLSGALPGGRAEGLVLPLSGNWSSARGLSVWRRCVEVSFDRLELANLAIEKRKVPLCPSSSGAIVRFGQQGLKIAAGVPALDLAGKLGETPIRIGSGPLGLAYPGKLAARSLDVELGPADDPSRFRIAGLEADVGNQVAGTFSDAEVYLSAVPLDLTKAAGNWRFADGALTIADAFVTVSDREQDARFQPLDAQGATLELIDNVITAHAVLREPGSLREVVRTDIRHDLSTGRGNADLFVDRLLFDDTMQPDTISRLALGIIANAEGIVRGQGRIDWNEVDVTSTGRFTTDSLDFAAAFGPVHGLSGTVEFTDLLGLVTAPDQRLRIAAINPGIEVNDGVLSFELRPDYLLAVNGAQWPFLGGELRLLPTQMRIGSTDDYRYTLKIEALDAAQLVERLEMGNIAADGTFDGVLPLVFDKDGGHIVGGVLQSRPPGGNLSYVGKLTYEDLSVMANFAFDALKSLDYREMRIDMDGSLEGEIVTRVSFDGIKQGRQATQNFITRQVARLPIHFNVNLRAPFFQLVTSLRSMYEPEYLRDPRALGLIDDRGQAMASPPSSQTSDESGIQPPASEDMQ
ncbi:MAG: YdbH domain-containing protein [Novosphingobium sp.]|nr:YdbH domain-containing protein [Novosphingobium sp.]MCP5403077.1 YdbH domain-containing protein [Novosphingobium sp.]